MNYTFSLKTESFLLTGSGEGGVLIDADVVFDSSGFPFIPARRIKGMLKESLEEVLEMTGKNEDEVLKVVKALFGEPGKGTHAGKLVFNNLFIEDWNTVKADLKSIQPHIAFSPDHIRSCYTVEIQQTAIEGPDPNVADKKSEGTAKHNSLRNYRVIKPDTSFSASLKTTEELIFDDEEKYLKLAAKNLRHAGTRRNRGFGKVCCEITDLAEKVIHKETEPATIPDDATQLAISITTLSPVIIAQQLGDQNTVSTLKYITGSQLRGLLAGAYIRDKKLSRTDAHMDSGFRTLFLSGQVQFGNLFLNGGAPVPSHLHKRKVVVEADRKANPVSVFSNPEGITRALGGWGRIGSDGRIQTKKYLPKSTFYFHNSRPNRAAGRNHQEDTEGGIFYYEALNADQAFKGTIEGDPALLQQLAQAFPKPFDARMGRSRSAQYGEVSVSVTARSSEESASISYAKDQKYLLILQSPLILLNQSGLPVPDTHELLKVLTEKLGILENEITLNNVATTLTEVEQYNTTWQAKSGKCLAYAAGSTFQFTLKKAVELEKELTFLGEWNTQGFGKINLSSYDPALEYKRELPVVETASDSGPVPETGNSILNEIGRLYTQQEKELKVKTQAIKDAPKYAGGLSNHLIGRLERLFESSRNNESINTWIKETEGKPAGDALKKAGLVNHMHKFSFKGKEESLEQIYWTTFFQTLRKKNKTYGHN